MKRKSILLGGILALLSSIALVVCVYAWYAGKKFESLDGKVNPAYFAGGNGSEEQPFLITNKIHMYNLAWLQYLGVFNKEELTDGNLKQYHFEIVSSVDEIDMDGLALPPIGTEENPFIGSFEGNGCVIKNVITSNNISSLKEHPNLDNFDNLGSVVGFFGVIGDNGNLPTNVTISSEINYVSNFFLDNIMVESNTATTLIGIVAGYVNANINDIGVTYSKISLASGVTHLNNMKVSEYALLGYVDENNVEWSGKPGSSGIGFGGSLNVLNLYQRMNYMVNIAKWPAAVDGITVASKPKSSGTYPNKGNAIPLMVDNPITKDYYADSKNTEEIISMNNIGYFTGSNNSVKINAFEYSQVFSKDYNDVTYDSNGDVESIIFYTSKSNTQGDKEEVTSQMDPNIVSSIIQMFNSQATDDLDNLIYAIRLSAQVSFNDRLSMTNLTVAGNTYNSTSWLPERAIWFVPQQSGLVKIVVATIDSAANGFTLYKINRTGTGTAGNPFSSENYSTEIIQTVTDDDGNLLYSADWTRELDSQRLYYFEIPVAGGNEYALGSANGSGPYLIYLDIGQNAGATPEYTGAIKDVDFVYDMSLDIAENLSDVLFSIDGTSSRSVIFYFRRNASNVVLYFIEPTNNGLTLNPIGNGNKQGASTKECQ